MKERIEALLQECLNEASGGDLEVLEQLLLGVKNKLHGENPSYITSVLQMEREVDEEQCIITMPINKFTDNGAQMVHGGITATLIDTTMGTLANHRLPEGYGAVTSNLHVHYIAPGVGKSLKAIAKLIHSGSQTMVIESSAFRDDGVKIAHCTSTFHIVKRQEEVGEGKL